eukprot:7756924-Pyramimonas_sp.AAC.1
MLACPVDQNAVPFEYGGAQQTSRVLASSAPQRENHYCSVLCGSSSLDVWMVSQRRDGCAVAHFQATTGDIFLTSLASTQDSGWTFYQLVIGPHP